MSLFCPGSHVYNPQHQQTGFVDEDGNIISCDIGGNFTTVYCDRIGYSDWQKVEILKPDNVQINVSGIPDFILKNWATDCKLSYDSEILYRVAVAVQESKPHTKEPHEQGSKIIAGGHKFIRINNENYCWVSIDNGETVTWEDILGYSPITHGWDD